MAATPDETRKRNIGIALIALVVVLLIVQLIAISTGALEVVGIIFLVFCAGWFALRSYQKRQAG